jgi:hypothetical protein
MRVLRHIGLPFPRRIWLDSPNGEVVSMPTMQSPRSLPFCSLQIAREAANSPFLQTALGRIRIYTQKGNVEVLEGQSTSFLEAG